MNTGDSLGPYDLIEPLGAGGMGEVWLAQDTRLGRKVAVKVLPPQFATDAERLARFELEARAAAALNHPHIAAIHDVGVADGTHYMVQEYLQGHTLRSSLERGPLPLKRALALGTEVAAGLAAAHRAGMVHRDLKPENIFITEEGHAKILDFGLAKLTEMGPATVSGASMSPTVLGTMAGAVMGTAGYMAPEQIDGSDVDRRADLFAFGCVLQEMVTGSRAFAGKSLLDTLHRIAHGEPEAATVAGAALPADLQRTLAKCLTRDRDLRYQHADDLRVDLQRLIADLETGRAAMPGASAASAAPGRASGVPVWALLAAIAGAVTIGALLRGAFVAPPQAPGAVRFELQLDSDRPSAVSPRFPDLDIAPSGDRLVYRVDNEDLDGDLVSRSLANLEATDIDCGGDPAFSPDGRSLACLKVLEAGDGRVSLVRLSLTDGATDVLIDRVEGFGGGSGFLGAGWLGNDRVVFADQRGLATIAAGGGAVASLLSSEGSGATYALPAGLPGGEAVLVSVFDTEDSVAAVRVGSGEVVKLVHGASHGRYVPPGFLVFVEGRDLRAVRFDARSLQVRGEPVTVVREVLVKAAGTADYAVSASGTLVYRPDRQVAATRQLVWVTLAGAEQLLPLPAGSYGRPRISPDGRYVAVDDEGDGDIWVWDLQRQVGNRLTTAPAIDHSPLWDPAGERIYFWSDRERAGIYRKAASGVGEDEFVAAAPTMLRPYRFLPDGKSILTASGTNHIYRVAVDGGADGESAVTPVLDESFLTSRPELSPDGRWLAYRGNETGTWQIYVRPFPDLQSGRTIITSEGGLTPLWSRDGRTLYYMHEGTMFAVPVVAGERFDAGRPEELFSGYENFTVGGRRFDIAPDGTRFLMVKDVASSAMQEDRMIVVLNWVTELERLLPLQ